MQNPTLSYIDKVHSCIYGGCFSLLTGPTDIYVNLTSVCCRTHFIYYSKCKLNLTIIKSTDK